MTTTLLPWPAYMPLKPALKALAGRNQYVIALGRDGGHLFSHHFPAIARTLRTASALSSR
jgi:hypothetical protein